MPRAAPLHPLAPLWIYLTARGLCGCLLHEADHDMDSHGVLSIVQSELPLELHDLCLLLLDDPGIKN